MATIIPATRACLSGWAALRESLWPDEDHIGELTARIDRADPDLIAFVATDARGGTLGFVEAALRHDHVNGCDTSPVAFVEGLYVDPAARGAGIARRLVAAVADWGRTAGCSELASDADLGNEAGHAFHHAIGFTETERVIFFHRPIDAA